MHRTPGYACDPPVTTNMPLECTACLRPDSMQLHFIQMTHWRALSEWLFYVPSISDYDCYRHRVPSTFPPSHLPCPFSFSLPSFIPTPANTSGERLSSRKLPRRIRGAFWAEKSAAVGAISVQFTNQRIKPRRFRFGGENCKTEADFYVSLAPT